MKEKLNKEELLKLVDSLKLDKDDFVILSSGSLVIRGIFPSAGDLDISVNEKGLNKLKEKFNLKDKGDNWYIVNEKIECVLDSELVPNEEYEGYRLQSLMMYYNWMKEHNREKDKEKLNAMEAFFRGKNGTSSIL